MIRLFGILSLFTLLSACGGSTDKPGDNPGNKPENPENETEANILRQAQQEIMTKMGIPETEKAIWKIHRAHLNADDAEDAVITLNRLEYAAKESGKSKTGVTRKQFGYMGNYNFFFIYDGKTKQISVPINIASSALSPLRVSFENIQSEACQDVVIEYRIRNSAFRNYYLYENGRMSLMFQWKVFDQVGSSQYEANHISFDKGSYGLAKDILIHPGKIRNYNPKIPDVYAYEPIIDKDGPLSYRFFYDPRSLKYMTTSTPPARPE